MREFLSDNDVPFDDRNIRHNEEARIELEAGDRAVARDHLLGEIARRAAGVEHGATGRHEREHPPVGTEGPRIERDVVRSSGGLARGRQRSRHVRS